MMMMLLMMTIMMMMATTTIKKKKTEKALDMLNTECHGSASFCFIGYQSNIVSRLVEFTRFRK
jgi:hypothetical protein